MRATGLTYGIWTSPGVGLKRAAQFSDAGRIEATVVFVQVLNSSHLIGEQTALKIPYTVCLYL